MQTEHFAFIGLAKLIEQGGGVNQFQRITLSVTRNVAEYNQDTTQKGR